MEQLMREAFRRHATGVAVVSATSADGPVGLTVSSVATVSVEPPAVSFSVMDTPSGRRLLEAPAYTIHLLGAGHAPVARDFARAGAPRFTLDQGWGVSVDGEPVLEGARAAVRAAPMHLVRVGTATLVVAAVTGVCIGPDEEPLVYHARAFVTTAPLTKG